MNDGVRAGVRIGELSRRVGVSVDVLRAWERRYGLVTPLRSASGQRLYSAADECRVRRMCSLVRRGFSPQIAARLALDPRGADAGPDGPASAVAAQLHEATARLDDAAAHAAFDLLLEDHALDTVLREVVVPFLHDLGDKRGRGEPTAADDHFLANIVSGRLHGLARDWDHGPGPRALAACPPGEHDDLGLLCFVLALRGRGWHTTYLGADTPVDALGEAAERLDPALTVVMAERKEPLLGAAEALTLLAAQRALAIGGRGASAALAHRLGARLLPVDPVEAADDVAAAAPAAA